MILSRLDTESASEGQNVAIYNQLTGEVEMGVIIDISKNRRTMTVMGTIHPTMRFGSQGWVFKDDPAEKYEYFVASMTDQIRESLHRKHVLEKINAVIWQLEDTATIELVLNSLDRGRAIVREGKRELA